VVVAHERGELLVSQQRPDHFSAMHWMTLGYLTFLVVQAAWLLRDLAWQVHLADIVDERRDADPLELDARHPHA
jgi:cytochrome oxidase assembly protein ShyY1